MALTNEDLSSIAQIINKGFADFKKELDVELDARFGCFEEKMDAKLDARFGCFEEKMDAKLDARFGSFKKELDVELDARFTSALSPIRDDISQIRLTIENVLEPQICLLAENYVPAAVRYEKASAQMESMQSDIDMLKKVVAKHSEMLHKLA